MFFKHFWKVYLRRLVHKVRNIDNKVNSLFFLNGQYVYLLNSHYYFGVITILSEDFLAIVENIPVREKNQDSRKKK